jgi:serine/threonine protein phosphatase PrpC
VRDVVIADIAGRLPPYDACDALVGAALAAGGHDNVSVGVFQVVPNIKMAAARQTTRRLPCFGARQDREVKRSLTGPMALTPGGTRHHG